MRIKLYSLTALLFTFLCVNVQAQQDFNIYLHAETFSPPPSLALPSETLEDGFYHVILQFEELPSKATHAQIASNGITLDGYLPKNAFYARIPQSVTSSFLQDIKVRSVFSVKSIWKQDARLADMPDYAIKSAGMADLNIRYFKNTDLSVTATALQSHQAEILYIDDINRSFTIRIPLENVAQIAEEAVIYWIEPVDPIMSVDNRDSKGNHQSNVLSANYPGGRNLQGNGVSIGVWDTDLVQHIDFGTRATGYEFFVSNSDHGNHVIGTIAGSGALDPRALGMAPEATIHAWNCCTNSDPLPYHVDMRNAVLNQGIVMTSNSYGFGPTCNFPAGYWGNNANLDQLVNDFPYLTHLYSAGNSQTDCTDPFYSITKTLKNGLLVAATNKSNVITGFSSFGPLYDGRIAPTISGVGQSVYSTEWDNSYGNKSGTSMSCPGVAGTIAQLYERYEQLYNTQPRADLIKALVCNTADEAGNKGPDYVYGFGLINGLQAVEAMESNEWVVDTIQNNMSHVTNITVPQDMAELKITLAWTDLPGLGVSAIALVNDLDLFLTNGVDTIRPWVLNPNAPNQPATTGIDNINNIEQITLDSLAAGTYQIVVQGVGVTNGEQTYALVYQTTMPHIRVTNPFGGETFVSGETENIHWTAVGSEGDFTIEYSIDSGATWSSIGTTTSPNRRIAWTIPNVMTANALVRVISTNLSDTSDATFTIAPVPNFSLSKSSGLSCGEEALMNWTGISGATEYEIFRISSTGIQSIGTTTNTSYTITGLPSNEELWFSIRATRPADELYGQRAIAQSITLSPAFDLSVDEIVNPISACDLGQENITLRISNLGCKTFLAGETIPATIELNGVVVLTEALTVGSDFLEETQEAFTFSTPIDVSSPSSYYDIKVTLGVTEDSVFANNILEKEIIHQPTFSTLPYIESFEVNNGFWYTQGVNGITSWEWGIPSSSSLINFASDGARIWVTDLNGDYELNEISNIFSPCFDFATLTEDPYLTYDIRHNLGGSIDRARMQYSLNSGSSWINLGGFYVGNSAGWETKQFVLNGASGVDDVQFRVLFNSDGNPSLGEGVAIDNFKVSQTSVISNTNELEATSNLTVYPNPSTGTFNIAIENMAGEEVRFQVTDALGKLVTSTQLTVSDQEQVIGLDLSQFPKGIYLLQMQSNNQQVTKKIILK